LSQQKIILFTAYLNIVIFVNTFTIRLSKMPKKFGTNSKAQEARERQATQKKEKQEQEKKAKEDALWYYSVLLCGFPF
jgi:hypothetical protein